MRLVQICLICLTLTGVALGLFAYKVIVLHFPLQPDQNTQSWIVEAQLRFHPLPDVPLTVSLFTPQETDRLAKVDDSVVAGPYGVERRIGRETRNQRVILTRRAAHGRQTVFYRAVYYELASPDPSEEVSAARPAPDPVALDDVSPAAQQAAQELIAQARARSADTPSFMLELVKLLGREATARSDALGLLRGAWHRATLPELAVRLANAAGIPARLVNGIVLRDSARAQPVTQWLEFHDSGQWHSLDVANLHLGIGRHYLPWWRGAQPLFALTGGKSPVLGIVVRADRTAALTQALWQTRRDPSPAARLITNLSLLELPVDTQLMFNIVLMIPVGALVIVLLRQMVGIPTFGTFMPVLMALSFRETGLVWGIALFVLIVLIGLSLRAGFDRLRLLVVPRLAAVLTIVVLLIAALTVILYRLGIDAGLSITLFPMVILTMTIERMALLTEEFGAAAARKTASGTVAAAAIAYAVMHNAMMEHLVFLFPELLLIVLAGCILLGRYNGYKLSEYLRFRQLARTMRDAA